ncbi:mucin-17-like isoform X8 [Thalassophryne amazonica]|uniref:mucin-17-like isoform X8 n=1 Tax=Thalassophryne amazonica TaxID=390379 RepID=UPI0014718C17|nr:mucin-17-like isoform X8 [Thalassophryne amazonica]
MARRSQCSLAGDNPLDPNYLHPHYREEYRLAVDALVEEELEGYYQFLQRADVVDFLSPPEIEYIQCSIQLPQQNFPEQPFLESEGDGSSDTYWPIHSDLDAPGLDLGWPPLHRFIGPTEVTTLVNPPEPDMPSIKEQARRLIKNAQQVIAVVMDVFTDVDIFADILQAAMRNVAVYVLLDEQNVRLFLNMASNCRVNLQSIQFLRVRTVCGVTYRCRSGKSIKGRMMDRFLLTDCRAVLGGNYSFMWSFEKLHRCMAHLYLGQLVSTFDEEFRILYAQSQPLTENLFAPMEDFALSLNKQYSSEPHLLSRDPRKFVPIDAYGREEWSRPPADERMDMKWKVMPHKRQAVMHRSVDQGPMDMYSRFPPQQIQIEPAFDLGSSRMPMMENPAFKRHSFAEGSLGRHSPYPFPQEQGISDFETQGRQFQRGQLPYQKMRSEVDYGGYEKFWSHAYLSSNQYSEPVFQQEMEPPESYNQMLNYVPFATDVYQGSEKLLGVPFTSARPRRSSAGQIYACQTSPPSSHMPDSQFFEEPNTDRKDPAVKRGLRTWRINSFLSAFDNGEDEDLRMTPTNVDTFDEPSNTIQQMAFGTDLSLPKIPDIREVKVPLVPRVSQLPSYIRSTTPTAAITQEPEKKIPEDCTAIVPETKITPTPSDSSSATEGDKTEEVEQKEPKTSVLRRDESFRRKYNAAVQTSSRLRSSLIFSSQLDPHVYQESKTAPGQQDEDDDKNEDEQTKLPFISQVLGQKRLVREPFEWSRYIKSTSLDTTATETSKSDDVSNKLYDKDSSKEKMSKDPSESQEKTTEALSSKSPDTEPTKSSPSDVQLSKTDQHEQQPKTIPSNPSYIDMSDPDKRFMFFKDLAAKRKAAQAAVEKKMQKSPTNPVSDLQNNTIVQKVQEETVVNVALPEKKPIKPSKDLFEKYTAPEDGQKAVSTETRVRPDVPQDSQIKDVSDNSCKEEKQVVPSKLEKTEVKDSQSAESCSMSVGEGSDGASPHTQTEEAKLPDSTTKVKVSVQTHTHTSSHILADSGPAPTKSSSQLTEKIELKPLNATSEKSNIQNPDAQQIESNVSAAPQLSESGTGITQAGVKVSSSHPSAQSSSSDQCRPDSSSQNSPSPSTSAQQTISSRLSSENARSSPGAFVLNIIPEEQVSLHPSPSESSQNKMSEESTSVIQTKFDSTLAAFSPLMSLHMPAAVDLPETEQQQSKPLLSHPSFVDMNDPQQRFIFFKELAAKRKAAQVAADKSPQKASVIPHSDSQKNSSVKKGEGVPEGAPENVTVSVTKPVTEKNATVPSVPGNVELEESQSGGSLPESADIRKDESPLQNQPQEETKLSEPVVIKSSPSRPATNAPPVDEPPHVTNYTNPDETAPSNVSSENSRSTSTSNALSPNSEKMEPQKSLSSFPSESSRDKTSGKSAISSAMQTNLGTTQVMVSPFMSKPATVELPKTDQQQSKPLLNELPPFVDMSDPQQRFMFFKELAAKRKAAQVAASIIPHSDLENNSTAKKGEATPEEASKSGSDAAVKKPITQSVYLLGKTTTVKNEQKTVAVSADDGDKAVKQDGHVINDANSTESCEEEQATVQIVPGNAELEDSQSAASLPEPVNVGTDGSPLQQQPQEDTRLSDPVGVESRPCHPPAGSPHPVDSETQNTDSTSEKPAPLTPTAETSNIQSSESQHTESNVTSSLQSSELSTSTVSEMLPCSTTQNRQSASDSDSALLSTPVETVASHVIPESSSTCMSNVLSPNAEKTETLKSVTPSPLESSKDKSLQSSRDKPAQHSTASSTVQTESASTEDEVVPSVPQPKPLAAELPKSSSSVQQYKALLSKPSHENVSELAEKQTPAQAAPEQRMENLAANPSSELQNDTIQKEEPVVEAEAVSVSSVKESISPSTALLENHTPTQDGQKIVFTEPCVSLKPDTSNKTNKQDTHVKDDPSMTKIHEEEQASVPSEVENTELKDNQSAESLPESAGGLKDGESPQSQPEEPQLSDLTTQVKESSTYHPLTTTEATHVNEPSLIDSVAPVADKSGTPTPGSASEMSTSLTPTTVPPPSVLSTLKSNVQSCGSLLLPSESNPGAPHTGSDESSDPSEPNSSSGRICPDSSSQTSPSPSVSDSALRSSSLGETVLSHTISEHSSPSPTTSVVLFPNSEETEPQKSVDVSLSESLQDKTLPSFQEKTSQNPSASSVTQADLDPTEGTSCVSEKESPESEHSSVSKSVAEESQVSSSVTPASPKEIEAESASQNFGSPSTESCLTGVTGVTNLKSGSDQDKSPLSPTVSAGHSQSTSSPVLSPNSQSDLHPSGSPSVAVASPEDAPTHATTPPELNLKDSGAPTADESVSCSTSPGSDGSPKAKKDETNMFPLPGDSDTHSPPQMPQADLSESPTETSTDCTSVPTETTLGTPADQTQSSLPHSAPKAVTSESFPSEPPVLQSDAVKESELLDPSERRPGDADAKNGVSQGNKECVSSAKANVQVSQKDTAEVTEDKVCPQSSQLKQQKSSQSRYHSSTANVISSSNLRDDTKLLLEQISANSQSRNELSKESVPAVTDDEKEDEADKKAKREIDRGITPLSRQLKTAEEREIILEKIQSMRKERKVYSRFEL